MNFDVHDLKREAVSCYKRATALDPGEFRWPYYCAIALRELGSLEAVEWFERSRTLRPDYPPLLVFYGQALFDTGRIDASSQVFRLAMAADPKSSHAYLGLAQTALSQGDLQASRGLLAQALQINPEHGEIHGLLAEVYRRLNEPERAELELERARQLPEVTPVEDPLYAELVSEGVSSFWYRKRGQAYLARGRFEEAARDFRLALQAKPDAQAHNDLGVALQYLGRFEEAIEHHRAALVLRPAYLEALNNLGAALLELGEVEEAIASVVQAKELDPGAPESYLNLGAIQARTGRLADAVATFREGLNVAGHDYRIANRLAWLLATAPDPGLRQGAEAVRLAESVCEATGYRIPEPLDVLAAAYAEAGDFDRAVEAARRAHELAVSARRIELADRIRSRLAAYEAGEPYREPPP